MADINEKHILIVEDDDMMAQILETKLKARGVQMITRAANGLEGIEKIKAGKPDLIIADLLMPELGGLDMLEQIRSSDWGKNLPVYLLTNMEDEESISRAQKIDASVPYIVKSSAPIDEVIDRIVGEISA